MDNGQIMLSSTSKRHAMRKLTITVKSGRGLINFLFLSLKGEGGLNRRMGLFICLFLKGGLIRRGT